jgi:tetratricopeptide (TPR) repeat protein
VPPSRFQPKLPRDIETICLKCLQKDPARRYATVLELATDLAHFLAGEPIMARPIDPLTRAARWCRRKPYPAALAATLVMAALSAVAGLFLWQRADFRRQQQISNLEFEQAQIAAQQLADRRRNVEVNQQLGLAELRSNRFESAEQFFRQAIGHLAEGAGLEDLRESLVAQHERIVRVRQFYQLSDKAERLAFVEHEEQAKQTCEDGLSQLHALSGPAKWWTALPADDLAAEQAEKLKHDANHQLLLLSALRIKHGLLNVKGAASAQAYRAALEPLERVAAFHEAHRLPTCVSARLLRVFCKFQLDPLGASQLDELASLAKAQPGTASDNYFLGTAYTWLTMTEGLSGDAISAAVKAVTAVLGVDLSDPAAKSQRLLRQAISLEPRHYWSYLWLGWSLQSAKDARGSELAFSNCITLRPQDAIGYAERARSLALQARSLAADKDDKATAAREALVRRCRDDLGRALERDAESYHVQLCRAASLFMVDDQEGFFDAARCCLEAHPDTQRLFGLTAEAFRRTTSELRQVVEGLLKKTPDHPGGNSLLAWLLLHGGDHAAAEKAATKTLSLAAEASPARMKRSQDTIARATAHYVLGRVHLARSQAREAREAFQKAVGERPSHILAILGRARAHAMLKDWPSAVADCDAATQLANSDWHRLEVHLQRAEAFAQLGRREDAKQELEKARVYNSTAVDSARARLLPAER